jgi:hypothetical protein
MASQIVTQPTPSPNPTTRTWADAELWCRDSFAQATYRRTFNVLTPEQQQIVLVIVQRVVTDCQFYLMGFPEPMNDYTRAQVQPGATTARPLTAWFDTFTRRSQRVQ